MAISRQQRIARAMARVEETSISLASVVRVAMDRQQFPTWEQRDLLSKARAYASAMNRLTRVRK